MARGTRKGGTPGYDPELHGARCKECPLQRCKSCAVNGVGPKAPLIAIVGEAPGCFLPQTPIVTPNGMRNIETLQVGDHVLGSCGGITEVKRTFTRDYRGRVVRVVPVGGFDFTLTPEHKVWAAELARPVSGHARRTLGEGKWLPASELTLNHALFIPNLATRDYVKTINLGLHKCHCRCPAAPVPDLMELDSSLAQVMGAYMADGSADDHAGVVSIHMSVGYKERHIDPTAWLLRERFHATTRVAPVGKVRRIQVYSTKLARFMLASFGEGACTKRVPLWIKEASHEIVNAFVFGWYECDGNHLKKLTKGRKICTCSHEAALDLYWLFLKLGVYPNMRAEYPPLNGKGKHICYYVEIRNSDVKELGWDVQTHDEKVRRIHGSSDGMTYVPVRAVEMYEYTGKVYNIETDTNNYLVPFVVHNSNEVAAGVPFIGRSGELLEQLLANCNVDRSQCYIDNALACMPPGIDLEKYLKAEKRDYKEKGLEFVSPIECCRPRLFAQLGVERCNNCQLWRLGPSDMRCTCAKPQWAGWSHRKLPRVVVPVGNAALMSLLGLTGITKWRGSPIEVR